MRKTERKIKSKLKEERQTKGKGEKGRGKKKRLICLCTFLLLRGPWEITNERWFRNLTVETRERKIEDTFHIYVICAIWNFTCLLKCIFFQYFKCIPYTVLTYLQYIFYVNNIWQLIHTFYVPDTVHVFFCTYFKICLLFLFYKSRN